ncbi:putative squalene monooxygenase [Schizosaccharomyces pombe]|uniref:Squalene epoxidase erg1 n=1 Tax=Schizosaccharomyces pombe (strain 972 / ATCC 24843) TaxID=284812 RepID=ERG1_SCHPO|nr:putative squalene monooxygenase Erg1 [Schizosaccharomyces pombe]Q9C1W3.1 RecName: Full=Squalene epoxidase erg1; Short=SE; AltName: Full=Ergosterol biosynthetic protein 1; AltName: Full=Squalene monooxygenase erg1 [Schizosaccharomyces pombe 972h-]CAC22613.1 squalene monooxygenase Erg1 (predicted) [Schizosaccharomyces pombe]|eukprot:NP_595351.1 putative squalene monooxygenase Erg1 [Schizosaccharomyces pombe]
MATQDADIIIIGAGITGCALGAALGRQGRKVLVLERDMSEPDRIVGELLQPGGIEALEKIGIADAVEGIDGQWTSGYQIFYGDSNVSVPYPSKPNGGAYQGIGFHYGRFVMNLRKALTSTPNVTVTEATVNELLRDETGEVITGVVTSSKKSESPVEYKAPLTIVCDGCFSKFRKAFIDHPIQVTDHFLGLILTNPDYIAPGRGHVILSKVAPMVLYPISSTEARILINYPGKNLPPMETLKKYVLESCVPNMPEKLRPSLKAAVYNDRLRSMPNQFLPPTVNRTKGMILVGDSNNMRHPLTGGGMTVCFHDAYLLSRFISPSAVPDLLDYERILNQMNKFHWKRKGYSFVINVLSIALYKLFTPKNRYMKALESGCIDYFKRGGNCVEGPIRLLGGLDHSPSHLIGHFYAVCLYGIYQYVLSGPALLMPVRIIESLLIFLQASLVIIPYILSEMSS